MSLWIFATLAAASFQTARFMLQKTLARSTLTATGATFARFLYSAPLVLVAMLAYMSLSGTPWPALPFAFWLFGLAGGVAQILATICVVALFKERNFAVGITFKKTEAIQAVLVGLIVLGEGVSWAGFACILLGVLGVLLLSDPPDLRGTRLWSRFANRAAALGLASGVLFAVSAVCYRGATLEVAIDAPLLRAGVTLAAVTMMQMTLMAVWLWWRQPGEIGRVWAARRTAGFVGLTSLGGSFFWFTAFAVQTAAYVKALGQVELILSLLASVLFFKETVTRRELMGMAIITASILGLLFML